MAVSKGLENLPEDSLREIMTRVGQHPEGAANIARTFSVSKTLRNFVNDGDVLRSISFEDSFSCSIIQYELLSEIGGLVVRCSRAGNLSAQIILSKVVLASSSNLCSANIEASRSDASLSQHSTLASNLTDLYKATRLLDHLSVENTDPAELLDLVRVFLSQANFEDIVEMQRHLKNFVALFLVHGKKLQFQQFLDTLDQFCEKRSTLNGIDSDSRNFVIEELNELCARGYIVRGIPEIDELVNNPLLGFSVEMNDDVVFEMLLERVEIVERLLQLGGEIALARNDHDALLVNQAHLNLIDMLRRYLRLLLDDTASVQSAQRNLLATFNAVFDA